MGLQRHGAHISAITLLGIAHIDVRDHYLSTKIFYKQSEKISINVKKDSALIWYMVLKDIASLASLMILGILLLKYEKRKEETNLENREYRI